MGWCQNRSVPETYLKLYRNAHKLRRKSCHNSRHNKDILFRFFRSRILVRAISYTVHGLIPASCVFADRYNREEVVRSLGKEVNINPPLTLGQLPDTPEELLKLDQVREIYTYRKFWKLFNRDWSWWEKKGQNDEP